MTFVSALGCIAVLVFSTCVIAQVPPAAKIPQAVVSDSEEMKSVFLADQLDRGNNPFANRGDPQPLSLAGPEIKKNDEVREGRVKSLLQAGVIQTGTDFFRAALVFQHSGTPDDQLLAHVLAIVSVEKGDASALWLVAATLDRYLDGIGKKQIFGTQFRSMPNAQRPNTHDFVQDDIEAELLSDALRTQFCVKPLDDQGKGLPGPPQGTSLTPCPAGEDLHKHFSIPAR